MGVQREFMISCQNTMKSKGVVQSYTKSRGNVTGMTKSGVTKLGRNQRMLMVIFHRYRWYELNLDDLVELTGLMKNQVVAALRGLVKAKLVERIWSKNGRVVYRLKGK